MNLEKATDKLTAGPGKEVALIEYETEGLWLYEKGPWLCDVAPFVSQISGVQCLHVMYVILGSPMFQPFLRCSKESSLTGRLRVVRRAWRIVEHAQAFLAPTAL